MPETGSVLSGPFSNSLPDLLRLARQEPLKMYLKRTASALTSPSSAVPQAPLSGRYEVMLPDANGLIFFTDSLRAAAHHIAFARWGHAGQEGLSKTEEVFEFLSAVEKLGFIAPGDFGVWVRRPLPDASQWTAKVRGTQLRQGPKYAVGALMETFDKVGPLPAHLYTGRQVRILSVSVLNDVRPGRQYGYQVGGGSGQNVTEDRLRPLSVAIKAGQAVGQIDATT